MEKQIGVVGFRGKLGRLLLKRPNFIPIDCDVTLPSSIEHALRDVGSIVDVIINCAGISDVDQCEKDYDKAIHVNVTGHHNLHKVFGNRILYPSSDYVFNGKNWMFLPTEKTEPSPINNYGWTKFGAETESIIWGSKIMRLSRSVSVEDKDIAYFLSRAFRHLSFDVPSFLHRSFLTREQTVDGLEWGAKNFDKLPQITHHTNYHVSNMGTLMKMVLERLGKSAGLVIDRNDNKSNFAPRPQHGGLRPTKNIGLPKYTITDTVSGLIKEYENLPYNPLLQ